MTPPITPETIRRVVLDNGIVVLVKENHANSSVTLRGRLRAGAMYDTEETSGLAQFTAASLQRGTKKYSFQKLNDIYDRAGMSFGVSAGTESAGFSGRALTEDFDQLLTIAGEVLLRPKFPNKEVEKLRGQFLAGLREANQDTRWVAFKNFRALCYPPEHPFHRLSEGTEETLKEIKRSQLEEFQAQYYQPRGAIFVIVGDIEADEAVEKVRKHFGDWKQTHSAAFEIPPAPERSAPVREVFELPGKIQSDVVMGYPGINRRDPDYYALRTGDLIFGQMGLYGRLGEVVRDRMGLAYYVYSAFDAGIGAGPWVISAGVNPKNVDRAIDGILGEVQRFRSNGVTQEELGQAQDFLTGSLALRLETNEGVAGSLTEIELYGLGLDYIQRYPDIIRGLAPDQIRDAFARHARIETAVTVIAGPPNGHV